MKMYAYITNPEQFLSDNEFDNEISVNVTNSAGMEDYGWIMIDEIDLDVSKIDVAVVRKRALEVIEKDEQKEIAEHEVKMQQLDERRQNLLALPHVPTSEAPDGDAQKEQM